jgi:precorrin-6A/cobalt-precorrin-6A reductase
VLVLGGTTEARELAALLVADGTEVETSLAGRVTRPRLPEGEVRVGGFGGAEGLIEHAATFDAVVDATHPFAATISTRAAGVGVPLVRLERPGWAPTYGEQPWWHWVDTHPEAATAAARWGTRPFLTTGRQRLADFLPALGDRTVLARVVDPPEIALPATWTVLLARGPYEARAETELMREHGIDVLVTKDSGGEATRPKLEAAAELGIPVVAVRRPGLPAGVPTVSDAAAARQWLRALP